MSKGIHLDNMKILTQGIMVIIMMKSDYYYESNANQEGSDTYRTGTGTYNLQIEPWGYTSRDYVSYKEPGYKGDASEPIGHMS